MACPICKKQPTKAYRPFCSKRCADIDLGKWMAGQYAVPSERLDETDELDQALEDAAKKLH